jgi:hypothetical protein
MMEAPNSSETSILTRATRRNIPEDGIFKVTAVKSSNLVELISKTGVSQTHSMCHGHHDCSLHLFIGGGTSFNLTFFRP